MKKYRLAVSLVTLVLLCSVLSGCDNRSQLEKDTDKAAQKVNNLLK
ncbi:MAG: hypothetical protein KKF80_06640 [Candidatus Omnitrophica bacterium]|nr:hypothetical protein [Candidatus Omnitrophota bacterium]